MKWLIFGGKGWIAQQVIKVLKQGGEAKFGTYELATSRADNVEAAEEEIKLHKPSHVLCLLGRTYGSGYATIDYLEQKGKLTDNVRDNLFAPLTLALICSKLKIHLTYLGTGCIFSYLDPTAPALTPHFKEADQPNFFGSSYSVVKGFTDRLMHQFDDSVLNVRIRMPIDSSFNSRNFISKITHYAKICSIANSMSVLPLLLPLMLDMALRGVTGTINLCNPGVISHNEILELYKEIVDPDFTWSNFSIEEQAKILLAERSNNELDCSLLVKYYPDVKPIREAVIQMLKEMASTTTLVTGGCGFIGSNFVNFMNSRGHRLVILDKMTYAAQKSNVDAWDLNHLYVGDVGDEKLVAHILKTHRIEQVVHFAAETHVDHSFKDGFLFNKSNIVGTHRLLECCHQYRQIKRFLQISTDEVYGGVSEAICGEETAVLNPTNPYAATKAAAEHLARVYHHSYHLPVLITRMNNVYGPRQHLEKLIPRFISLLLSHQKCTIHGKGDSRRNFIFVTDACHAIYVLLNEGEIGKVYNIGAEAEYSVHDIAENLIGSLKPEEKKEDWMEYVADRCFNDCRYAINSSQLRALGWRERVTFDQGLKETITWYRERIAQAGPSGPPPPSLPPPAGPVDFDL